jgi:hypothetical protein
MQKYLRVCLVIAAFTNTLLQRLRVLILTILPTVMSKVHTV